MKLNILNKNIKNDKAITLIALVITIIVLLILAGVTIVTLTGDNGLFKQSYKAKMLTEIGEIEERIKLKTLENKNQQLVEGSLDSIGLDISENIINKYKDIVYVKNSKLYLSFIANYPQIDSYKNNKEKIEALKDKLDITYDSIKTYNKIENPYFNRGIDGWGLSSNGGVVRTVLERDNNKYMHMELNKESGYTAYIFQNLDGFNQYADKLYYNVKYNNEYIDKKEGHDINNDIIRIGNNSAGYAKHLLNGDEYINSYQKGWKSVSCIYTTSERQGLRCSVRLGGGNGRKDTYNYNIDFDDVYLINLTEIFGAGDEPTKEQMDEIFNNF